MWCLENGLSLLRERMKNSYHHFTNDQHILVENKEEMEVQTDGQAKKNNGYNNVLTLWLENELLVEEGMTSGWSRLCWVRMRICC